MATESRNDRRERNNITALDVAKRAGVSQTTVSRSFSFAEADLVSKATRERVLNVAAELGYSPNIAARVLAGRRSHLIGLLVNNFHDPEHLDLFRFVSAEAQQRNYHALLLNISQERGEIESLDTALQYQVDGLLVAATHLPDELAQRCQQQQKPIVVVGRKSQRQEYSSVYCDNRAGAADVADQMFQRGVQRPAFIGGKPEATVVKERQSGFVSRVEELFGMQPISRMAGSNEYDAGFRSAQEILRLPRPPDAVFCTSDLLAVALLDAIAQQPQTRLEKRPLVYGFGQSMLTRLAAYDFTSVGFPIEEMVRLATSQLINQIEGDTAKEKDIVLSCRSINPVQV